MWARSLVMADVRALLKAKREEQRISHPCAAYNQGGQLRCTACSTIIKYSSAWNGHLGSKSHRTNAARVKEEEKIKEAKEDERRIGKRRVVSGDGGLPNEPKPPRSDNIVEQQSTAVSDGSTPDFPLDFFSDPSRSVVVGEADFDEEEEGGDKVNPSPTVIRQSQTSLDLEWAKFQEAVINAPVHADARETFEGATIFAEPQLSTEIPEGFPSSTAFESKSEFEPERTAVRNDEGEERRKREEEEKELIMDRLLDEERAQEEADERVNALKARLDLLRQKRLAARTRTKKLKANSTPIYNLH